MIDKLQPPVTPCIITSPFGRRVNPINGQPGQMHPGVDLRAELGQPVYAAADGVVSRSYRSERGPKDPETGQPKWWAYGETIVLAHVGFSTRVAHLSKRLVHDGEVVAAGQIIGHAGSTGDSTGPHVHFEVLEHANPVDPAPLLEAACPSSHPG